MCRDTTKRRVQTSACAASKVCGSISTKTYGIYFFIGETLEVQALVVGRVRGRHRISGKISVAIRNRRASHRHHDLRRPLFDGRGALRGLSPTLSARACSRALAERCTRHEVAWMRVVATAVVDRTRGTLRARDRERSIASAASMKRSPTRGRNVSELFYIRDTCANRRTGSVGYFVSWKFYVNVFHQVSDQRLGNCLNRWT